MKNFPDASGVESRACLMFDAKTPSLVVEMHKYISPIYPVPINGPPHVRSGQNLCGRGGSHARYIRALGLNRRTSAEKIGVTIRYNRC